MNALSDRRPRGGAILPPAPARHGVRLPTRAPRGHVAIDCGVRARRLAGGMQLEIERQAERAQRSGGFQGVTVPRLSAVAPDKARLSIPLGDDELKVVYRPSRMTPALLDSVQAAERSGSISGALLAPLSELLVSWDLTDDDGETIATTPDALGNLPFVILRATLQAIAEAMAASVRGAR